MPQRIIVLNAGHEPKIVDPFTPGNGCGSGTSTYHGDQKYFYLGNKLSILHGEFEGVINESKFTQDQVERISQFLHRKNYSVVLSCPPPEYWVPGRYLENLIYRVDLINCSKAEVAIDIHANGNPNSQKDGFSIIIDNSRPGSEKYYKSLLLAEIVFQEMCKLSFGTLKVKARVIHQRSDLRIIRDTNIPAILIECGYMTNPVDMKLLALPKYRELLAEAISDSIDHFFTSF